MNLTARQMQIATSIDNQVANVIKKEKTSQAVDDGITRMMPDHMAGLKHLLHTLNSVAMNKLCEEHPGLYRFAKMMERVAEGCRDGLFDDIISTRR